MSRKLTFCTFWNLEVNWLILLAHCTPSEYHATQARCGHWVVSFNLRTSWLKLYLSVSLSSVSSNFWGTRWKGHNVWLQPPDTLSPSQGRTIAFDNRWGSPPPAKLAARPKPAPNGAGFGVKRTFGILTRIPRLSTTDHSLVHCWCPWVHRSTINSSRMPVKKD